MNKINYVLVLCGLLIPFTVLGAGIFKWVDADGIVHFSDRPGDHESKMIDVNPAKPDAVTRQRVEDLIKSQQEQQEDRLVEKEDKESEQQKQAKRQQNCNIVRDRLQQLNQQGRLYKENEKGEREFLSDEARAASLIKTQQDIEKWCN